MLLFDCVIFFLTLYKAFTMGRGIRLLHVMVRDGASNRVIFTLLLLSQSFVSGAMYFSYEIYLFVEKDFG